MSRSKSGGKQNGEMEKPKRYVVRTGLFLKNPLKWEGAKDAMWELVFCSSGEGCWVLPSKAARAKSVKCGAAFYDGDLLHRGACIGGEQRHEVISLEEAYARALITPAHNSSVSLPVAVLLWAHGLYVPTAWRAA